MFLVFLGYSISCVLTELIYGATLIYIFGIVPEKYLGYPWEAFQAYIAAAVLLTIHAAVYYIILAFILYKKAPQELNLKKAIFLGFGTIAGSEFVTIVLSYLFPRYLVDSSVTVFLGLVIAYTLMFIIKRLKSRIAHV